MGRGKGEAAAGATVLYGELRSRNVQQWQRNLPIKLELLPPAQRHELEVSISEVLEADPVLGEEAPPLYEPSPNPRPLPQGAPRILGVCGKPRAGKDVIADYLAAHYAGIQKTSFSASVIPEVNAYLEAQGSEHRIDMGNKSVPIYRKLLQSWGMAQPTIDPDYWVNKTKAWAEEQLENGTELVIITGVRLPPDVAMIKEIGGETWRAVRPGNPYEAEHAVESGIDDLEVDREILNDVEGELGPYEANIEATLARASS